MSKSVTVIIPTYNSTHFIKNTIDSIINQSIKPDKLIVIDDNSDDLKRLKKIINKIKNNNFKNIELISNSKNKGPGFNRNLAWSYCNTTFIAFCDDDDYWYKDKLKYQLQIFEKRDNTMLVASKKKYLNEVSKINKKKIKINLSKLFFFKLIFKNYIPTSSVVIRSDLKDRFSNEYYAEDYFLWLSILKKKYECYFIKDYLCEEINIKNRIKLSSNKKKIYRGALNVLNQFYSHNIFNNLLIYLAKLYYYFKMIIKTLK